MLDPLEPKGEPMTYDIYDNQENGETILLASGLTEKQASEKAVKFAMEKSGITIEWNRASDGQHGYLNQDGSHAITGKYWD